MKILLGLSGGLDSTYSAELLRRDGHEVICACLYFGEHTDIAPAKRSAEELGLPFTVIDCSDDFERYVMTDFIERYAEGRTPNPCTVCNRYVKIESLYRKSIELGCDAFATGHYADVARDPESGRYFVQRAGDLKKDQSYMLWKLAQNQLSRFVTPLARLSKSVIRERAAKIGLEAAASKESQDICFIPRGESYISIVESRLGKPLPGNYTDRDGNIIGRHGGIINYTVGQRKGLGASFGKHMFVTAIDPVTRNITLCPEEDTYARAITVGDLNFQKMAMPVGATLDVKIRYAAKPVAARVTFEEGRALAEFEELVRTPAPGQSAVFYDGDDLAFGGTIDGVIY